MDWHFTVTRFRLSNYLKICPQILLDDTGRFELGAYTNSVYQRRLWPVVRQTHHERETFPALTVRPEPVEGCHSDIFMQSWYKLSQIHYTYALDWGGR